MIFTPVNMIFHQKVVSVWPHTGLQGQTLRFKELVSRSRLGFVYVVGQRARSERIRGRGMVSTRNWRRAIISGQEYPIMGSLSGNITVGRRWCRRGRGWIRWQRRICWFVVRGLGGHLWPWRDRSRERFCTRERLTK